MTSKSLRELEQLKVDISHLKNALTTINQDLERFAKIIDFVGRQTAATQDVVYQMFEKVFPEKVEEARNRAMQAAEEALQRAAGVQVEPATTLNAQSGDHITIVHEEKESN